ncbi:MBL fold metallo-hydrolase [Clostridium swellfunianum]|uniref:ComEC/Rec2 family competence protein n=1 Tax=Clostridium swellfunianum TaxID=1367462 RepID=UPI00202E5354|nr:ComEC/Rec2 family competence protein [Clostridium swellfunianum]MCM0648604.1 MBL fold metallo-hydrolase [Clostridium swellfunianum]
MNLKNNKLLQKKWFQVVAVLFILGAVTNISQIAAGILIILATLLGSYYLFFKSEKFKTKKVISKIGIGFLLFCTLLGGFGFANPPTPEEQAKYEQQRLERLAAKNAEKQAKLDEKKAEEAKKEAEEKDKKEELAKQEEAKKAEEAKKKEETNTTVSAVADPALDTNKAVSGQLKVHFINVGQADSILIQQGNSSMLIDAGNNDDAQTIKNYLDTQGIKSLDFVVGTHAHEDHIGSMDYIINSFKVGKVYFPKQTSTTKTFQDFVSAVKGKGLQLTVPTVGDSFKIGDATATILAPNGSGYEDANDYSITIKLTYGSTSFLLTGDAESVSESQMVSKGLDLSATVLKIGHHGSKSSTNQSFLNKVNPNYGVISVGKGNSYGHPTQEVMDRLKSKGVQVYRTDENGTVVATSDGTNISFNTSPGSYNGIVSNSSSNDTNQSNPKPAPTPKPTPTPTPSPTPSTDSKVYWLTTGTSKSYHKDLNCQYIRNKTTKSGTIQQAAADVHDDPCDRCAK